MAGGSTACFQGSGLKFAAIDLCGFETPCHQPEPGGIPYNKNEEPALLDAGVHGTSDEEQDQSAVALGDRCDHRPQPAHPAGHSGIRKKSLAMK
jgi:hypothetical protein